MKRESKVVIFRDQAEESECASYEPMAYIYWAESEICEDRVDD